MADDYDTLQATVKEIARLGLDWAMADLGLQPYEDGWQGFWPGQADPIKVWSGGTVEQAGEILDPYPNGAPYDFPELIGQWNPDNIQSEFLDWYTFPDPSRFDDYHGVLEAVAARLSVNTVVTPDGDASAGELESGNGDLDSQLVYLNSKIGGWSGTAMDTLLGYTSRLPSVIRGQKAIACLLGAGLTAEQEAYTKVRQDIMAIATGVKSIMDDQGAGAGSEGVDLGIVGAVLSGASLFFTAGTSAAVIGGASAALGALEPFLPKDKAATETYVKWGADSPAAVLENMRTAFDKVSTALGEEEDVLKKSLTDARYAVEGDLEEYDQSQRPSFVHDSPQHNSDPDVIDVEPPILGFVGASLMPEIAAPLTQSRNEVGACNGTHVWYRPYGIGFDDEGSSDEWMSLAHTFVEVTSGTAGNLKDMGQAIEDVAALFINVDQTISEEYGELTTQLGIGDDD